MDQDLEQAIRKALEEARTAGRDYIIQNQLAVRAAKEISPDITASETLRMVNLVRRL